MLKAKAVPVGGSVTDYGASECPYQNGQDGRFDTETS